MTRTFSHPLWRRLVTIDDDGIHEDRRGRRFTSITWDELESLRPDGATSTRGTRIALRLSPKGRRDFAECASEIWNRRYPDRWQRNKDRTKRSMNRAAYFWFPLFTLGPSIACYVLVWSLGWPESLRPELQKLHRLTLLGAVTVIGFLIWYIYRTRKVI